MARKPRVQFPGAIYHVINRGNYRRDMFGTTGAAEAFVDCLWEACEQSKWKVHAYCVMRNHYHLAIETPQGNLVEGVHWLQSTFGNRFNRFRDERGRAFQSRYKAILIEPGIRLLYLTSYIHLNPVRAHAAPLEKAGDYPWSSLRAFTRQKPEARPRALVCKDWLPQLGGATDSKEGWREYQRYLERLMAEEALRKAAGFNEISRGWVFGSPAYRRVLLADLEAQKTAKDWGGRELSEINNTRWELRLEQGLAELKIKVESAGADPKSADWKVGLAAWMKANTRVTNRWLSDRLNMGPPDAVSRYNSECRDGTRMDAKKIFERLTTKVRG